MKDETIYYVKKDLFTGRPVLKTGNRSNKCLNLAVWSETETEAWNSFEVREKERIEEEKIAVAIAKKEFNAFKAELHELLEKYNASIFWSCSDGSDTYRIFEESLCSEIKGFNFKIVEGDSVCAMDLKKIV